MNMAFVVLLKFGASKCSQGATCDHVMAHLESFRANTVDAAPAYVAISRARISAAAYTDSRARLTEALGLRDGAQAGAMDESRLGARECKLALGLVPAIWPLVMRMEIEDDRHSRHVAQRADIDRIKHRRGYNDLRRSKSLPGRKSDLIEKLPLPKITLLPARSTPCAGDPSRTVCRKVTHFRARSGERA